MITVEDIAPALPRLSGDAVKAAVLLGALGGDAVIADVTAVRAFSKQLGISVELFRCCVDELVRVGILARRGRVTLTAGAACGHMCPAPGEEGEGGDGASGAETPEQVEPLSLQPQQPRSKRKRSEAERKGSGEPAAVATAYTEPRARGHSAKVGPQVVRDSDDETPPWETGEPVVTPLQRVIDAFDKLYREANEGAPPTWDGRQVNRVKALLKAHSAEEVVRRATLMFTAPPPWPPPPHDLATLQNHFDRFARPGTARGGVADRGPARSDYYAEEG